MKKNIVKTYKFNVVLHLGYVDITLMLGFCMA